MAKQDFFRFSKRAFEHQIFCFIELLKLVFGEVVGVVKGVIWSWSSTRTNGLKLMNSSVGNFFHLR